MTQPATKPVTDSPDSRRRRRRSSGTVLLFSPRRDQAFTPTQLLAQLGEQLLAALLALASYSDKNGECEPGLRALARHIGSKAPTGRKTKHAQIGVSLATAQRRMQALAALGVIEIEDRGGQDTCLYRIDRRYLDAAFGMLDELLPNWRHRRMIRCKQGRTLITIGAPVNFIETQRTDRSSSNELKSESVSEIAPSAPRQDARRCASLVGARSAPRFAGAQARKPETSEPGTTAPLHPRDAAVSDGVPPEERPSDEEIAAGFAAIRATLERRREERRLRPPDPALVAAREANERGRLRWIQQGVPPLPRRGFR